MDFNNYRLKDISTSNRGVYDLADGLLPEMARAMDYDLDDAPTTESLKGFIEHIGPAKTLQDNLELVRERLSTQSDAVTIAADWADRSGSLKSIERSFAGVNSLPRTAINNALLNTVVGRWQERRASYILHLLNSGIKIGRVIIFAGNRVMREAEHPRVVEIAEQDGELPTEGRFAELYTAQIIRSGGVPTDVIKVESTDADEIFDEGLSQNSNLVEYGGMGPFLAVGNAPSSIQVAGQFRKAALKLDPNFDCVGSQLFVAGDSMPVARHGEGPETHQNPFTALGQIARNALMLHEQAQMSLED